MASNGFQSLVCVAISVVLVLVPYVMPFADVSHKKGLGVSKKRYMCHDLDQFTQIHWWYDWGSTTDWHTKVYNCTNPLKDHKYPMIWGWPKNKPKIFNFSEPSEYLLGFNEPNHPKQAYMTPEDAAIRWKQLEKAGRKNGAKYFVSPAASPGGDDYIDWFDRFFANCTECQIDYLATHMYACSAKGVMRKLKMLYKRYNRTIWLTEFACPHTTDPDRQLEFMKDVLPRLEKAKYVDRYAWYCSRVNNTQGYVKPSASLLHEDVSKLTSLGEYYNNFRPRNRSLRRGSHSRNYGIK